jgi:hypothetical protein
MVDPSFLENFGSGAGGGFLGVLLGWLINKKQLDDLRQDLASKAPQHELDMLKDVTDGLVRERTCIARTEGLAKTLSEKIDAVNSTLATRIDGLVQRIDNSSRRFDKIDMAISNVHSLLMTPFNKRTKND